MARPLNALESSTCTAATKMINGQKQHSMLLMCQDLQLSTVQPVIHDINYLKHAYPQQFYTVGNFAGEAQLLLKDDAEAFIDAPRKCSIHMKEKLKQELRNMVSQRGHTHSR